MKNAGVYSALALANLFWAGNFIVGEIVSAQISPVSLTFFRWLFAAIPLVLIAWVIEKPDWRLALREWKLHLVQSLLGLTGYTLLLYSALGSTGAVTASVISAANPALIALGAALLLREKLRRLQLVGLIVSFVGVVVVLTGGDLGSLVAEGVRPGDMLVLAAVVAWTVYSLIARRIVTPPVTATAMQAVLAVITMLPVVAFVGVSFPVDLTGTLGLIYIIVFPSMAAYALWNIGASRVGPAKAGIFLNLLPVFTVLIAVALGAALSVPQLLGGALVFVGVYLTLRVRNKPVATDATTTPLPVASAPHPDR